MLNRKIFTKMRALSLLFVVFVLAVAMIFGLIACNDTTTDETSGTTPPSDNVPDNPDGDNRPLPDDAFLYDYATSTEVGYYGQITKTNVRRNNPVVDMRNGGLDSYPVYGTNYNGTAAQADIIAESSALTATGTANAGGGGYTWMDENGRLYNGTTASPESTGKQLYMHTAAVGNYHGDVADSEPGVEKVVTIKPRGYNSYSVTGIYAPAGEVIKIQISEEDMEATGGITVHIGQALYNGQANNIWAGKAMPRMPHLLNTMQVNKNTSVLANGVYTAYVGSFLGGPLYIRNTKAEFTATISGGVEYPHFILGYTTKEEYNRIKQNCSAPYFDLEVWSYGVLISGARKNAERFSYDDLFKAAVLWEKISQVTTTGSNQGIVFLFEPFVAAGAAVAFPGRSSVNCPEGWMSNALDYNLMVSSGAWGNFHEYHHNFQGYGVGNGGEVTNNAMTLVSYALFTKISANRGIGNYGAQNLSGWNTYTSATWALNDTLKISRGENPGNGKQGLALYATLIHNFGADNFIQAKRKQQQTSEYRENYLGYMQAWQDVTHNDMTYYFKDVLQGITAADAAQYTNPEYPMFVPVSSVYQTGRSYTYDGVKKQFTTMQPYVIPLSESFDIDLSPYTVVDGSYQSGSVVIPQGFTYKIKSFTTPANGTVTQKDDQHLVYFPADTSKITRSGKIVVTLEITKTDGAFRVADVDLTLEFETSREFNKMTLERTTYYYDQADMYADAQTAYESRFAGYTKVDEKYDHSNPTQNSNTDIWFWPNTDANHTAHPNAPEWYFVRNNTIDVIEGKLYAEEEGKYRVYLRGRLNCAVYYSLNGIEYRLGATIKLTTVPGNSHLFRPDDENTYFDVQLKTGGWVYFKEVLIVQSSPAVSYIGLGMKKWTQTMFTVNEKYFASDGSAVDGAESANYAYSEATFNNSDGTPVAVKKTFKNGSVEYYKIVNGSRTQTTATEFESITEMKLIAPTITNNSQPYINAYRTNYEFPENSDFKTDYFYKRTYNYNYTNNAQLGVGEQSVVADQCKNLNLNKGWGGDDLSVVVDGIKDAGNKLQLHTNGKPNATDPFTLVIDLGKVYTANRLLLYSQSGRTDPLFAKALKLYSSLDGINYTLIDEFLNTPFSAGRQIFDFDDTQMRYYKIEISESYNGYIIVRELEMWHVFEVNNGAKISPDSDKLLFTGDWNAAQAAASFGHVYVGAAGAKLSFSFTGTRLGIMTSAAFGKNFEVYIDGNKVSSIDLKSDSGSLAFLSNALTSGTHKVEVVCTGEANIDSIILFD